MKLQPLFMNFKYDLERFVCMDLTSRKLIDWRKIKLEFSGLQPESLGWEQRDYAELAGALIGSDVSVDFHPDVINFLVVHDYFSDPFRISFVFDNGIPTAVLPDRLHLKPEFQNNGVATRLIVVQAKAAARLGFSMIAGRALKVPKDAEGGEYNGAYTFGRLGFDSIFDEDVSRKLPSDFSHCKTLLQLMATSGGRKIWSQIATSIEIKFHLKAESESWKALNAYLTLKKIWVIK